MYVLEVREQVDRIFKMLGKKDGKQMEIVAKEVQEILEDPHRFKALHFPLIGMRRVHLGGYVLVFSIDEARKAVVIEDHEHHDKGHK